MNPVAKEQWIAALRSGEYKQGREYLEYVAPDDTVKHCCLGVLCRVALANGVEVTAEKAVGYTLFDGQSGFMPSIVMDWAGLTSGDPQIFANDEKTSFVQVNDELKYTFNQIADLIEAQL